MINNRDLSWLDFNDRVLQEAQDKTVPLLQRLRFLGIFSNNQDEFIKVRVANVIRMAQFRGKNVPPFSGNYPPKKLLPLLNARVLESQDKFNKAYHDILNEMETHGIFILNETELNEEQKLFCVDYFSSVVSPRLVPLIIRKSTKMPFLTDKSIYHAVKMTSKQKSREVANYAIIQIPVSSACPRFVQVPSYAGRNCIIYLDDIIRLCLNDIFFMFNYDEIKAYTFKITRDAQLTLDDDISKSLLEKIEDGIENRLHGQPIRMVYDRNMPDDLLEMIKSKLRLRGDDSVEASGRYHLKKDLMKFPKIRPELEDVNPPSLFHPDIKPFSSLLSVIHKKDIFLNYPYHTFNHFIDFLREAAIDPKVESIYITLYRTAGHSKVVNALVNAAKNGKKVYALLELFARFDEEQNVESSEQLQKGGVKVIHGVEGLKVHSKLVLVERKESAALKGYVYVGTGNFNEDTARLYGDFGIFTSANQVVQDAQSVFDFLLNPHRHFQCKQLFVSPYYLRSKFEGLIAREIKNAEKGKKAFIYAKFNSLTDERMINWLYKASQAGVEIRLIVRGACCLQPQVKGLSENIRVISIVDKYLEHARLTIFCNDGDNLVHIMSADWMTRNLDRRVEIGIPIADSKIIKTLKKFFAIQWADNVKARDLSLSGQNNYVVSKTDQVCRAQVELYDFYKEMKKNEN